MFVPPFRMRIVSCCDDRRLPTWVRSGPFWPPVPATAWHWWQPRFWNCAAPRRADSLRLAVTAVGIGGGVKLGDQGACSPTRTRIAIESADTAMIATAQGRRQGLRSPLLARNEIGR